MSALPSQAAATIADKRGRFGPKAIATDFPKIGREFELAD
jgi:hypothetical protein